MTATLSLTTGSVDTFLSSVQARASDSTFRAYRSDLRHFTAFMASQLGCQPEEIELLDLTPAQVKAYVDHIAAHLAGSTVARRLVAIKSFYRHHQINLMKDQKVPKVASDKRGPSRFPRLLSPHDVESISYLASDRSTAASRDVAILQTIFVTGRRLCDVLNLESQDIDIEDPIVAFGDCEVDVTRELHAFLLAHRNPHRPDAPVFRSVTGRRLSARWCRQSFDDMSMAFRADVPALRHGLSSRMARHSGLVHLIKEFSFIEAGRRSGCAPFQLTKLFHLYQKHGVQT